MPAAHLHQRLEGRGDVLEVTRVRYRALVGMVRALFWKERLRRNAPLLHQVALAQPVVDALLDRTLRRAEAEGWPADDPFTVTLREVAEQRATLRSLAAKRLGRDPSAPLPELLLELEATVAASLKIEPGQRWAAAHELLPWSLPELIRASERGDLLERLLKRPLDRHGPIPFTSEEAAQLAAAIPQTEDALAAVWRRVDQVDPTFSLHRFLQKRSRRAPLHPPRSGPEALMRALFWLDYARSVARQLVEPRVAPVPVRDAELWPLLQWLVALQSDALTRLEAGSELSDARAGLFELAHELNRMGRLTERLPLGRFRATARRGVDSGGRWDSILARARRAEQLRESEDAAGVRQVLTRFIRMRTPGPSDRTAPLESASFEHLVLRAAELSAGS